MIFIHWPIMQCHPIFMTQSRVGIEGFIFLANLFPGIQDLFAIVVMNTDRMVIVIDMGTPISTRQEHYTESIEMLHFCLF